MMHCGKQGRAIRAATRSSGVERPRQPAKWRRCHVDPTERRTGKTIVRVRP
jgi:hypothetical protein